MAFLIALWLRMPRAFEGAASELRADLAGARQESQSAAKSLREEVSTEIARANQGQLTTLKGISELQHTSLKAMTDELRNLSDSNRTSLDRIRSSFDERVRELQEGNEKKRSVITILDCGFWIADMRPDVRNCSPFPTSAQQRRLLAGQSKIGGPRFLNPEFRNAIKSVPYRKSIMPDLAAIKARRLSGDEPMPGLGAPVVDFWRWAFSDLLMNTSRGVLAEFIVAKGLGISTDGVRAGWDPFDLETDDGIKIEVKSASYVQSWRQPDYSTIQFSVAPKRGWDSETNTQTDQPARHADYYVFALLAEKDQSVIDPTDVTQWRFWIVGREFLDARSRSQHSITLASLKREVAPDGLEFSELERGFRAILGNRG